jgi:hypothetical protein
MSMHSRIAGVDSTPKTPAQIYHYDIISHDFKGVIQPYTKKATCHLEVEERHAATSKRGSKFMVPDTHASR